MTMSREVEIKLFGAFRQYSPEAAIAVSLPDNADVAGLRQAFAEKLDDDNARALLQSSAFATDEAILDEEEAVPDGQVISVLPPVCGG